MVNDSKVETDNYNKKEILQNISVSMDTGMYSNFVGVKQGEVDSFVKENQEYLKNAFEEANTEYVKDMTRVFIEVKRLTKSDFELTILSIGKETKRTTLPIVKMSDTTGKELNMQLIGELLKLETSIIEIYVEAGKMHTGIPHNIIKKNLLKEGFDNDTNLCMYLVDKPSLAMSIIGNIKGITQQFKYITPYSLGVGEPECITATVDYNTYITNANRKFNKAILDPYKAHLKRKEAGDTEEDVAEPEEVEREDEINLEKEQIAILEDKLMKLTTVESDYKTLKEKYDTLKTRCEGAEELYEETHTKYLTAVTEQERAESEALEGEEEIRELKRKLKFDSMLTSLDERVRVIEHGVNTIEDFLSSDNKVSKTQPINLLEAIGYDEDEYDIQTIVEMNEQLQELELEIAPINVEQEEYEDDMFDLGELPDLDDLVDLDFLDDDDYVSELLEVE